MTVDLHVVRTGFLSRFADDVGALLIVCHPPFMGG